MKDCITYFYDFLLVSFYDMNVLWKVSLGFMDKEVLICRLVGYPIDAGVYINTAKKRYCTFLIYIQYTFHHSFGPFDWNNINRVWDYGFERLLLK